jgi:hypothetical protein
MKNYSYRPCPIFISTISLCISPQPSCIPCSPFSMKTNGEEKNQGSLLKILHFYFFLSLSSDNFPTHKSSILFFIAYLSESSSICCPMASRNEKTNFMSWKMKLQTNESKSAFKTTNSVKISQFIFWIKLRGLCGWAL